MNHDFCPSLNRYVYWLKQPIGWVVGGALASLLVGIFVGPQGFILMSVLIALFALGAAWPWLSMKGLTCRLYFQQNRAVEGQTLKVILEVVNRWPIPAFGLMLEGDFLQDVESDEDHVAVGLKRLPAWSVSKFEWPVKPDHRGKLPGGTPRLTNGFPFGLYLATQPVDVQGSTIVWPGCESLEGALDLNGLQFDIKGLASDLAGNEGETIGVRKYRHGDPIKNIHWMHTARCNRLIVRERQVNSRPPVRILIDLTPENHVGKGSHSTYEWAIRIASAICRTLHEYKSRIELVAIGLPSQFAPRTGDRNGLDGLLDYLALLPQVEELQACTDNRPPTNSSIEAGNLLTILVCTRASSGTIEYSNSVRQVCVNDYLEKRLDVESFPTSPIEEPSSQEPAVRFGLSNGHPSGFGEVHANC